ncbi:hypothetical protein ASPBRDRAFT_47986 [Aspergillus brasiliensis CBS 101740]|uniref:Uncharacterized protein n=1 Tax=Aspergillus brasiliensis (strain CBS 101740 / IMI 381727 / IBT 21946) TaxID=767769 RepID=A0A1L9U715_ASPBC|nr:hypothetical protein ASPBRDRAFT_47986 [Aspergillus brasiliensis CBS 101740]
MVFRQAQPTRIRGTGLSGTTDQVQVNKIVSCSIHHAYEAKRTIGIGWEEPEKYRLEDDGN